MNAKLEPQIAEIQRRKSASTATRFDVFWIKNALPSELEPYASEWEPFEPHFMGGSGLFWRYSSISNFIEKHRRDLADKPAMQQIKEIGLEDEFAGGLTKYQVPGTFYQNRNGWLD